MSGVRQIAFRIDNVVRVQTIDENRGQKDVANFHCGIARTLDVVAIV